METVVYDSFFGAVFKSLATLETDRFQNVPFLKGSIFQLNRFRKPFVFISVMANKLFVAWTTRNRMPARDGVRQSEIFFSPADQAIVVHHAVPPGISSIVWSIVVVSNKVWRSSIMRRITSFGLCRIWTWAPQSMVISVTTVVTRSAILVLPQSQKLRLQMEIIWTRKKIVVRDKTFRIQSFRI